MNNSLEIGAVVKINMERVQLGDPVTEAHINAEGRIVGNGGGDYQVLFFAEEGPLWFGRDELIDTGKRGPGAIADMKRGRGVDLGGRKE